jgi:protein involved in polysaccharide export with SLBB domain
MVTVFGEVRNPTTFALTRQMRISEALGTVGGPTLFADDDEGAGGAAGQARPR